MQIHEGTWLVDPHCGNSCSINRAPPLWWQSVVAFAGSCTLSELTEYFPSSLYLNYPSISVKAPYFRAIHLQHSVRPFIGLSVCLSSQSLLVVTTISHEQPEQSQWNLQGFFLPVPTNDSIRFWRYLKVKVVVTASHLGGKGVHVDAGASKSIL